MKNFLCYYELHVGARTFILHVVVEANSKDEALEQLKSQEGAAYHLQVKGCLGIADDDNVSRFMTPKNCVGA